MKKRLILAAYIFLFWILLPGLIVTFALWIDELAGFRTIRGVISGILVLCLALPLLTLSIIQFRNFSGKYPVSADPPAIFIRTGLYAVWRHPIYLFYTLTLIGVALLWGSGGMLLVSIPAFIALEAVYTIAEEKILVRRFGDSYRNYRKITPLIIPRFYFWMKIPCFLLFRALFSFKVSGKEHIPDSPPFFLVSAHRNYLDPFYLAQALPYPIRYITTFEMFRSGKIRWFFRALDCIPKKRYLHDVSTGRQVLKAIRQEAVIGVFPEGERIWTGTLKGLKPETLNLFKKFSSIPILPVRLQGNFFAWPRWGKGSRRAHVKVEFLEPIKIEKEWDMDKIRERIEAAIDPDDLNHPDFYCKSHRCIDDICKVIYRCPLCRTFEGISLHGEKGKCNHCGGRIDMDERYKLTCRNEKEHVEGSMDEMYKNIRVTVGELEKLSEGSFPGVLERMCRDGEQIVAYSEEVQLSAESFSKMKILLTGPLMLTGQRIAITQENEIRSVPLKSISSVTTESNYKLQVYDGRRKQLYQMVFGRESVLKWQDLIAAVMEKEHALHPNLR